MNPTLSFKPVQTMAKETKTAAAPKKEVKAKKAKAADGEKAPKKLSNYMVFGKDLVNNFECNAWSLMFAPQ